MNRRIHGWTTPELNQEMKVAAWGHAGKPVLLFPTAGGDFLEAERFLMLKVLTPLIEAGRIRVYACGSVSGEAWMNEEAHPGHKAWLQSRFDNYLSRELVPWIRHDVGDPAVRIIGTGASLGGFNAVNAGLKHPDQFWLTVAMSGTYDFDRWMHGYADDHYYFNQPFRYLPGMGEGLQLEWLRKSYFHIATGQGRWEAPWESVKLGQLLGAKGIPNYVDLWGHDVDHDWPTWRTMLPMFLDRFV
ncbi:MAG: alpha/beta hydrolase-fold protein [Myxococcota bacterium]